MLRRARWGFGLGLAVAVVSVALGVEGGERITQERIASGDLTLEQIRIEGLKMFASRFTRPHGYGDGPLNVGDTVSPGGRPSLGANGSLLRINGLDGQSCVECHSIVRADTMPPTFGIGGVGGAVSNAMIKPTDVDPADLDNFDGDATFNGRFANPPFVFGAGAVELLGLEMTMDLQALREAAIAQPGVVVELVSKGVRFGTIVADGAGNVDTGAVEGVDPDLVVEPFGRKGEFATTREFDIEAVQFHFGMQPNEVVGDGNDADGDGIIDEVLVGELSALSTFVATIERPQEDRPTAISRRGRARFGELGCSSCHMPALRTEDTRLPMRFPEVRTDPAANAYLWVSLVGAPVGFPADFRGGIYVPLFADLKRHDMGPGLAENFGLADEKTNREFTTARLWGVADTAPYLHDGRASTLAEAIELHGGEAQDARDAFVALDAEGRQELLAFLGTLRTPERPLTPLLDALERSHADGGETPEFAAGVDRR